ncbi:hypothetical protein P7C73_g2582, partial [Tremellales sp. Uapishka_1]
MNAIITGRPSLWHDIWPLTPLEKRQARNYEPLNLTSISVGNGWINGRVQYRTLVEFACGGAVDEGIMRLANEEECRWAKRMVEKGEELIDRCKDPMECAAAGQYTAGLASFPYDQTGLNPYDYRRSTPYDETGVVAFYNNATVQAELGVIEADAAQKVWDAHSARVHMAYVYSGDWDVATDFLFERLLRSGVSVLKYEGMVDWICNYIGIRRIMSNLPNFRHQESFNNLSMRDWHPQVRGPSAGTYKCLPGDAKSGDGNLCYVEIAGAGHILSLDKAREGSLMIGRWMHGLLL